MISHKSAEVEAEIKMLRNVLCAAGLNCDAGEQMTDTECRTFLISRLKHVPGIIEDLRRDNKELANEVEESKKKIKSYKSMNKSLRRTYTYGLMDLK